MAAGCISRWLAETATAAGSCRTGGGEPRRLALVFRLARWRNVAPVASRVAMAPRMGNRFGKRPGNDKRASENEQSAASSPSLAGLAGWCSTLERGLPRSRPIILVRARASFPESRRNAAGGGDPICGGVARPGCLCASAALPSRPGDALTLCFASRRNPTASPRLGSLDSQQLLDQQQRGLLPDTGSVSQRQPEGDQEGLLPGTAPSHRGCGCLAIKGQIVLAGLDATHVIMPSPSQLAYESFSSPTLKLAMTLCHSPSQSCPNAFGVVIA